jgi:hypothetical protein
LNLFSGSCVSGSGCLTYLNLTDTGTGYKVFKREIPYKINLKENRFGFEIEITIKLARLKYCMYEVRVSYWGRDYSEGKKIPWKNGVKAVLSILKYGIFKRS